MTAEIDPKMIPMMKIASILGLSIVPHDGPIRPVSAGKET
jgi:hypothetical protein